MACSILLFGLSFAERRLATQILKAIDRPLVIASCCTELHIHRLVSVQKIALLRVCEEFDLAHHIGLKILDTLRGQQEHMLSLVQRPKHDMISCTLADWWTTHTTDTEPLSSELAMRSEVKLGGYGLHGIEVSYGGGLHHLKGLQLLEPHCHDH